MNKTWSTTVNELMKIFHGALISVIPWLEKAKIEWKEGESYDDWDKISTALFENIVCTSLYSEVGEDYPITKYLYDYSDYSDKDYILIKSKKHNDKIVVFISFQSISTPLDSVKAAILDTSNKVVGNLIFNNEDLNYSFVKNSGGKKKVINEIDVVL